MGNIEYEGVRADATSSSPTLNNRQSNLVTPSLVIAPGIARAIDRRLPGLRDHRVIGQATSIGRVRPKMAARNGGRSSGLSMMFSARTSGQGKV
jgi:hypothetical protein